MIGKVAIATTLVVAIAKPVSVFDLTIDQITP